MAKRRIDGLSFKAGPTQSGVSPTPTPTPTLPPTPIPPSNPVGGELLGIDAIAVFLSRYWPLLLLLAVPFVYAIYVKRNGMPKWLLRLTYWLKEF